MLFRDYPKAQKESNFKTRYGGMRQIPYADLLIHRCGGPPSPLGKVWGAPAGAGERCVRYSDKSKFTFPRKLKIHCISTDPGGSKLPV